MPPQAKPASTQGAGKRAMPKKAQLPSNRFLITQLNAFYVLAAANLLAARYAPIQDCDEVYNYWEPAHYLVHGYGLQTWEYSPEYAIRSWLYICVHALPGALVRLFTSKTGEFYVTRVCIALFTAYCESHLYTRIAKVFNPRVGVMFMMVLLASPGMFHASAAFLPSAFSMCFNMLGTAAFLDWPSGSKAHLGIMWFGVGGVVGWPFAAALIAPFMLEELFLVSITGAHVELLRCCIDGITRVLIAVFLQLAIDAFFYHKVVVVPWRIVMYNIFSGAGRGPSAFGTEPANFFIRNLLINFNVWFVLAGLSFPVLALQCLKSHATSKFMLIRGLFFTSPFYIWLAVFSLQPHKEERFMYPIYPCIALNAALTLHAFLGWFGNADPQTLLGKVPAKLKLFVVVVAVAFAVQIGFLRTTGVITGYQAPLQVYSALSEAKPADVVCLGKEWHRFPSSYFLPKGIHAKFVRSEFNGLLPGEYSEAKTGFGFFPGTWLVPRGMNDENLPDVGKYTDVKHCTYLVDSHLPSTNTTALEPAYVLDESTWERVKCVEFLDAKSTGFPGRLLWLPDSDTIPEKHRRRSGQYCLLRRRNAS